MRKRDLTAPPWSAALASGAETWQSVARSGPDFASGSALGAYVKRLEELEEIANSFNGVDKAFAIQAGREIRIVVQPDRIDDAQALQLARDVAREKGEVFGPVEARAFRRFRSVWGESIQGLLMCTLMRVSVLIQGLGVSRPKPDLPLGS